MFAAITLSILAENIPKVSVVGISSPSWRPASVDTEHGAKLPKNPAIMGLSGQNDM
jgi:hypothetical protein